MKSTEQSIYFCHPVFDNNKEFETKCIKKMKNEFGNDINIVNPFTDIIIPDEDKKKLSGSLDDYIQMLNKYFLPVIDKCDAICVFTSDYQKYADGVFRETQYALRKKKVVVEWWRVDRIKFYEESGTGLFIDNFFDVKKGVRCIVGHEKDMYRLNHEPHYREWNGGKCRAYTLQDPILSRFRILTDDWTNHCYIYTYDKSILQWHNGTESRAMFRNNKVGLNAVIELDSPDDPNSDKAKRLTFFNHISEFDMAIEKIVKVLEEWAKKATKKTGVVYKIEYNLQFSGNGVYIYLEGYYEDNLLEGGGFKDNFINILDTLKEKEDLGDKTKVHICNSKAPWNKYFKVPFSFHETRNRISIPLPKGKLDGKWIDRVSNVDNIMNDYINPFPI